MSPALGHSTGRERKNRKAIIIGTQMPRHPCGRRMRQRHHVPRPNLLTASALAASMLGERMAVIGPARDRRNLNCRIKISRREVARGVRRHRLREAVLHLANSRRRAAQEGVPPGMMA